MLKSFLFINLYLITNFKSSFGLIFQSTLPDISDNMFSTDALLFVKIFVGYQPYTLYRQEVLDHL